MLFSSKNILLVVVVLFLIFSSCKNKNDDVVPEKETGTVTDIDGNTYKTIKIGNQWWMAENLKVTKFRDGTSIPQRQDNTDWKLTSAAYCIFDNSNNAPGFLYNFYVIEDANNIAPLGWHIPSDDEWKTLEVYLGMEQSEANKNNWRGTNQGEKLKIESPNGWTQYSDIWSINESGFSALAGSCRLFNGIWGDPGLQATGFWWSSTLQSNQGYYRYLDYKNKNVFRYFAHKNYGFSIRCVKD